MGAAHVMGAFTVPFTIRSLSCSDIILMREAPYLVRTANATLAAGTRALREAALDAARGGPILSAAAATEWMGQRTRK